MNVKKRGRLAIRRRTPPGSSPGTLVVDPAAIRPEVHLMRYGPEELVEQGVDGVDAIKKQLGQSPVTWVDVRGLGDLEFIEQLGDVFEIHGLALEDVVNVHQRPKVDEYEDHLFIVARMHLEDVTGGSEQFSLFLGKDYVLTFQERPGDCFEPVRNRIRQNLGRIRRSGPDYLAYALLDALIDVHFPVLERFGEVVEALEERVISQHRENLVAEIHQIKRGLLGSRRAIWPMREMMSSLTRDESTVISEQTRIFLRDCYDHTVQLMDMVETYREIAASLVDIHLSALSYRMNETMKVLTIIATIFIPLGFIAGVYGMNFNPEKSPWNMPELGWYLGYPFALGLMVLVAVGLVLYFKHKGWLGQRSRFVPRQIDI
ncbi:MAG TPA: magnesium/cobalt transporter CorA [Gammaproteobacteria bacterium]|nr:magnesium/cobalt transporter CorA [Gammaproteobacteria bacterium]